MVAGSLDVLIKNLHRKPRKSALVSVSAGCRPKISTDAKYTASLAQISGREASRRLAPEPNARKPSLRVHGDWIILGAGKST